MMDWCGLAIALSIGFFALPYARSTGDGAAPVTAWVAGVVTALAVGLCALFVVLAHRELRRWWRPMTGVATAALLGLVFVHLG